MRRLVSILIILIACSIAFAQTRVDVVKIDGVQASTEPCYITSAASNNSTNCKASAGKVFAIHVTNTTGTNYFLRMYDVSGAPNCAQAAHFRETVPALATQSNGRISPNGMTYRNGIGFCLTGGGGDNDNTNAATGVYITVEYK